MANPTVPDFTDLAARKLAELQANGYRITGYCFERQVEGAQPQRGFVDFAGFVGWWRPPEDGLFDPKHAHLFTRDAAMQAFGVADTMPDCGFESCDCRRYCKKKKAAHGVADMKGGKNADA